MSNKTKKEIVAIGKSIAKQIGNRAMLMYRASRHEALVSGGLRFYIGRNAADINLVQVFLNADDTYTIEFANARGLEYKTVSRHEHCHCTTINDVIYNATGMLA